MLGKNKNTTTNKRHRPMTGRGRAADRERLEQGVRTKLRVIFSAAKKQSRDIENRCNVSATQLWTLQQLQKQPGTRVSDLAQVIFVHNSTASNLLDTLEKRALVRRERAEEDHRVVRLYLTPKGRKIVANAPRPARAVVSDALAAVPLATLKALDCNLEKVVAGLKIRDVRAVLMPISDI